MWPIRVEVDEVLTRSIKKGQLKAALNLFLSD